MPSMEVRNFTELLGRQGDQGKFLCVGLDSDFNKIPAHLQEMGVYEGMLAFNRAIIDATKDIAASYKPNSAFYEAQGSDGLRVLRETSQYIHEAAPEVPVILDAKRADIGNTNEGYVTSIFDYLMMDAVTVHPYLGREALEPFLKRKEKGVIVLCRTSNTGAGEFQDLKVNDQPLYMAVAHAVSNSWNVNGNCSLVVGATYTSEMKEIRAIAPEIPFLIPGIGAQGGDLEASVKFGKNIHGKGLMISASRAIIFASGEKDFAEVARIKAIEFDSAIRKSV